ncbi:MAG: site-2 protease family protein [Alphaproteobacteria bacterium]
MMEPGAWLVPGGPLFEASTWILPVLLAVTLHEAAHGFAAWWLGDDTAYRLGRVSANPLRHVDPVGTVILPAALLITGASFLFGWAKPVPVDMRRLRHPRSGMVWVAAAGPGTNLVLALVSAMLLHTVNLLPEAGAGWVAYTLFHSINLNLVLAVFNLLPLPPLDGGRIAVGILPWSLARRLAALEKYGFVILLGLIVALPLLGQQMHQNWDVLGRIIGPSVRSLSELVLSLTGVL